MGIADDDVLAELRSRVEGFSRPPGRRTRGEG